MKILIADDDMTSRHMLSVLMQARGYEIETVANGIQAAEALLRPSGPKLALLDWMMPRMDGLETCRLTRRLTGETPIYLILVTSRTCKRDITAALRAGADDYITKPFDGDELIARVDVGVRMLRLQNVLGKRLAELNDLLEHVKTLQGLLPICMYCHKIRDEGDMWQRLEQYIERHTDAVFSHGLCPQCLEEHFPENEQTSPSDAGSVAKSA